ncbi:bacillithiol system redox-active protein YtxJ [Winogradskyella alexanderae]|uniref:Bacillithiol system redox-active protein YtxJ n=1 Tax=Winogradskyella alexanderae TaxID=2877123 RepID=A0ABS7XTJ3_9FLAO|nr:bacillithiol system redox-active protein YtxJ [Winogradskyella alexanderae]MCA0133110.1 bacillithiol system redox-active protein YtxJ [Winogradskyella alexanderae]
MFKKLFGSSEPKEEKILPWIHLTSMIQLDEIAEKSKTKTQLIFKHSTRCGISRMVLNQFADQYQLENNADLYYLDLLNNRDVSNEVASKFQVIHQSPQLLILNNGVVVAHDSHGAINELDLVKYI